MRATTHHQFLSFRALTAKTEQMKQFDDKPARHPPIDNQCVGAFGMASDTGNPREEGFESQSPQPCRDR